MTGCGPLSVVAYTDGSGPTSSAKGQKCIGPGGWAAVVAVQGFADRSVIYGAEPQTTVNRMEVSALLGVLSRLHDIGAAGSQVHVHTDSSYLKNAHTQGWLKGWQRNGWISSRSQPVVNRDLWEQLLAIVAEGKFVLTWTKIKGHSGDIYNEAADTWARYARDRQPALPVVVKYMDPEDYFDSVFTHEDGSER